MPLTLDDEACLVFFELKYFYNHAPMVGNLKTIKVWVATNASPDVPASMIRSDPSGEFKDIAISAEMGQIPGKQVALMDTTEIFRFKPVCKHACFEIIHMFVNCGNFGRHKCVQKEEIKVSQKVKTLLRDVADSYLT